MPAFRRTDRGCEAAVDRAAFAVPVPLAPPMAPASAGLPFHRAGAVYDGKVDGWSTLAYKDGARVRLISRNAALTHTAPSSELAA